eukprot:sb/3472402/
MDEAPIPEPRKRARKAVDRTRSQDDGPADGDLSFQEFGKYPNPPETPGGADFSYVPPPTPSLFSPTGVDVINNTYLDPETLRSLHSILEKSNQLQETEQAIIVNFLKGNRQNPQPEKGNAVTILLNSEIERDAEGGRAQLVEILFEMNYETGRWRRLKRQSPYHLG